MSNAQILNSFVMAIAQSKAMEAFITAEIYIAPDKRYFIDIYVSALELKKAKELRRERGSGEGRKEDR